ncbi:hypothetical protein ACIFOC_01817 [Leucobacter aridicollis]
MQSTESDSSAARASDAAAFSAADGLSKGERTRARLVHSMLELIQLNGYSGTGLAAVTEHAGAPKGSMYFHFPDGKEGLGAAAVELAQAQFEELLREAAQSEGSVAGSVRAVIAAVATIVSESDYRLGCPVSVVTLEMGAESDRLRATCERAFSSWIEPTAGLLGSEGLSAADALSLATAIVAAVEGAVVLSRAMRTTQPLESTADLLADMIAMRAGQVDEA